MDQNSQQPPTPETPAPMPHLASEPVTQQAPVKRKRKGLWAGIITAAAVVVLGGGVAAGYFLWYQNPEKVLSDSLTNMMNAKTLTYTGLMTGEAEGGSTVRVEVSGKGKQGAGEMSVKATVANNGQEIVLEGSGMIVGSDTYVRFQNIDKIVDQFLMLQPESAAKAHLNAFIAKINNQWVKIAPEDTKEFDQTTGETQKCMTELSQRIEGDDKMKAELVDAYKTNTFVKVAESLGSKDDSLGYRLEFDEEKYKKFFEAFEDTELYKQMYACNENYAALKDLEINDENMRTEIWIHQWSHEMTKFRVESTEKNESDFLLEILPLFNKDVEVVAPESAVTFDEIRTDFEKMMQAVQEEAMQQAMYSQQGMQHTT